VIIALLFVWHFSHDVVFNTNSPDLVFWVSIVVGITEISAIVAAAGVLVGVVYYVLQLGRQSRVRQTELVMRLYSQFTNIEFQILGEEVLKSEAKDLAITATSLVWLNYGRLVCSLKGLVFF